MKINRRLRTITDYISDGSNIIDVGCDHALLCIYLVKNKKNIKCIASDINEGPLEQAKNNIEKYNESKSIKIKLGNGIDTIEDFIDTVIISGMGGKTIVDILLDGKDKLLNVKKIILSPNNEFYLVRKSILRLGYKIKKEQIVLDKGKYYPIIVLEKGNKRYNKKELMYGVNCLVNKDLLKYYKYLYDNIILKLNVLPKKYFYKRIKLFLEKEYLNKLIKKIGELIC